MREHGDSAENLLRELLELAVKGGGAEGPTAPAPERGAGEEAEVRTAGRPLGLPELLGGVFSGPASAIVNQAIAGKRSTSWLKWLNPIAGAISLFTGGKRDEEQPAAVMSPRPARRSVEYGLAASEGGAIVSTDRDERGRARLWRDGGDAAQQQIVVQVQAMDSRSFLDHRDEIASAVRQALMESHGLGSVLSEFQE